MPDDNFESYLETHDANGNTVFVGDASSMGNGIAGDNQVTTSRIVMVTSLDISSKMISDITGIEDFTALEILNFSTNGVGNFDLSNNINLKELYCASNGMSGINVTANINLEVLDASGNFYTAVDVSSNIKLKTLNLASSGATSLNLGNISTLEKIDVSNNNLTNLDISNLSSLTDLNCDTNYNLRITDFSASTDLVHLNCNNTDLRSLDVSSNTLLETLKIDFVSGFDVDLSNNIVLTSLSAQSSDLTSLNIKNGNNSNITSFDVRFNQFSCIQVDDPTASYLSTWQKDSTTTFNLDCSVTSVPDINFEYYLENHDANGNVVAVGNPSSLGNGKVDDGYVLTSRIATVTSLNISFFSVGDLTGIEDFTALEILNCSNNDFNDLDLSNQPNLKELYCHNVFVSIIDVSANLNLEKLIVNDANCTTLTIGENTVITELNASNNKLTVLDITDFTTLEILDFSKNYNLDIADFSALTNLEILNCSDTGLRSIDLSANTLLEVLTMNNMSGFDVDLSSNAALTSFSARESDLSSINIQNGNNANITNFDARLNDITLNCIQVDDPIASYLSSWDKDATTVFSLDCSETNVPDDNFENYLETHDATGNTVLLGDANSMGNGIANDNTVYTSRIANITSLNITDRGIADLTGIEDFVALQDLNCYNNGLSSIDVSENLALLTLNISRNSLTDLDVSKNTLLTELHVARNSLTSLDVSQNIALITLGCSQNQLNGLDVTKNTALKNLYCYTNPLGSLDVTQNTVLESLDCVESQLTSLDVSRNPELQYLQVYDNLLTSLDVSKNVKLIELYVEYNQIASLDVSKNTALEDLSCFSNQLTYLNIRNGNNTNLDHRDFDITNNPGLTCVAVDDPTYATTTFTKKDVQTSFSTFCNTTYVPDDNFETYLETHDSIGGLVTLGNPTSMGNGIANDDYVGTEQILNIKNLNISNQGITDLTGLEAFIGLEELRAFGNTVSNLDLTANINLIVAACSNMGLTTMDVSGLTALKTLELNTNQLSSIDVSSNVSLENLRIINNQLSAIDVGANKGLRDLRIQGNNLISLDISANTVLRYLSCVDNDLTNLDVQNNVLIENLSCGENQFTTIDVSTLINLTDLFIENTPTLTSLDVSSNLNLEDIGVDNNTSLTSLDLTNNTKLIEVYANNTSITKLDFSNSPDLYYIECQNNNALTFLNFKSGNTSGIDEIYATGNPNVSCIQVDDPTAVYLGSWNKDATASFAEYCELTYVPNDNFEALLEGRGFGNGIANDNYVYTELIAAETVLIIQDKDIVDLTGIEDFESLEIFLCRRSNVETVDISNNTKLTHVNLVDNSLTALDVNTNVLLQEVYINGNSALGTVDISTLAELTTFNVSDTGINTIDVSNNPLIRVLILNDNEFTTLDVSSYPNLVQVLIANNKLTSLNVANGNNTNFTWFDASGNPDLTCIQVDDVNGNFNLWTKDATANYAHYCELTNVPDDNFENYLETHDASGNTVTIGNALSMGNGIANDNQVATSKIEIVTTLNIEHQDIADLTGIEDFKALESLNCDYNELTSLDLSSNTNLKILDAAENNFISLDLTGYTVLEEVELRGNILANLQVDNNPNLKKLRIGKNALTTLDVTACIQLEELLVHQNLLASLDVRNGNNALITNFAATGNSDLTCIEVDDASAGYLATWDKDDTAGFSEDCITPIITLLGDNPQIIELGSGYTELGATVDAGVTNLVIDISDFVDVVGIYTIRYNATDNAGNMAEEVIRTVEIVDNCPLNNVSANNFTITTTSETCADKNNGTIAISAETVLDYRTTINGQDYNFTSEVTINNLPPGTYPLCITIEGFTSCEQCFEMVIEEAESLTGKTKLLAEAGTTKVNVEVTTGTAPYTVKINNEIVGEYTVKNFILEVQHGDELEVSSNIDCEGKLSTIVSLFDQVSITPNPTKGDVTLTLPGTQLQTINVSMYNALGVQVSSGTYIITSGQVTLPMEQLPHGIYFVSIDHGATFKIVKQ
ncbi:T9SS type A sorting domain-containing protein [Aquimarina sp. Aq78]|uniref:immunoglobulin-like domain-containing protein n=1 Tax=Aquimarina sp. Aq78 TaxID=1191889 RepID=UPI000D105EA7|nr:T9SS type A sorting domain-containing protein [Aquimarina sp. Aq78]